MTITTAAPVPATTTTAAVRAASVRPVPAVRAAEVWKVFGVGDARVTALRGINLELDRGAFTAIVGAPGSGKSTLMHCLAGLDTVTRGRVDLRDNQRVGFVFQHANLLPTLTAAENILLPLSITGAAPDRGWFDRVVGAVGIRDRLTCRPIQLSGGEQQRVACARALIARPDIIFADEPTGNLNAQASAELLTFLRRSVAEFGQTIVMVTHDAVAASFADRMVFLADGELVDEHPSHP
jgi:putative ABC transport system ATP-binding protein